MVCVTKAGLINKARLACNIGCGPRLTCHFAVIRNAAFQVRGELVLGQSTLTGAGNASILHGPFGVAIDRSVSPNRIYVADTLHNRILGWDDVAGLTNGDEPKLVLGQQDFDSYGASGGILSGDSAGPGPGSLSGPTGVAVDGSGNVYVADTGNNRVLEYNEPFASCASLPCAGPVASAVFGQGSGVEASGGRFTTSESASAQRAQQPCRRRSRFARQSLRCRFLTIESLNTTAC